MILIVVLSFDFRIRWRGCLWVRAMGVRGWRATTTTIVGICWDFRDGVRVGVLWGRA
jgi:hypothetical protein